MTNIRNEVAGLIDKVQITEDITIRRFALDVGLWVGDVTGRRPYRVDSAELVGFVCNTVTPWWPDEVSASALADAIVDHFQLDEEKR